MNALIRAAGGMTDHFFEEVRVKVCVVFLEMRKGHMYERSGKSK